MMRVHPAPADIRTATGQRPQYTGSSASTILCCAPWPRKAWNYLIVRRWAVHSCAARRRLLYADGLTKSG